MTENVRAFDAGVTREPRTGLSRRTALGGGLSALALLLVGCGRDTSAGAVEDLLVLAGNAAVRDLGLLASAAARPRARVFGEDAYPDLYTKAAALVHSLAGNHALVDGNEWLAWRGCAVFLDLNGHRPNATQSEAVELVVAVADGSLDDVAIIAERLKEMTS